MTTAVVTGVAGFIGSRIASRLLQDGATKVVGIDRLSDYYSIDSKLRNIDAMEDPRFEFVRGDLTSLDLAEVLSRADVIFHQAGQPGVRPSWGSSFDVYVNDNILASQRLLEAVANLEAKPKIVYASSSSVYGNADTYPVTERTLPRPLSPYGVSKLAAEHMMSLYAANRGVDTVSLRYFTVYGPGQRPDMAFTRLCRAALDGSEFTVLGTGEQVRDFTFVDDVVEANLRAWKTPTSAGDVFNVAGGASASLNRCIELVEALAGSKLDIARSSAALGDVHRTEALTDRTQAVLNWTPVVDVETGLAAQIEWMRGELAREQIS